MSMRGSVAKSGANLRRRTIRRRVIALGVAGVTIAGAQIGVSMLGDTGTVDAAVTQSSATSKHIYAAANGGPFPLGNIVSTYAGESANGTGALHGLSTVKALAWSAAPGTTGSVSQAGDVAIVDATTESLPAGAGGVTVTMYISNLAGFAKNYTSFALPVGVYQWNANATASLGTWVPYAGPAQDFYSSTTPYPGKNSLYISDSDGSVTLTLPKASKLGTATAAPAVGLTGYYEIVIDKANGFWQSAGQLSGTDLGPSFYLTSTVS